MRTLNHLLMSGILLSLAACSQGGGSGGGSGDGGGKSDSVPPVAATGEGCMGIYGDPPATPTSSPSAIGDVPFETLQACVLRGGELLDWTDAAGNARKACLHTPAGADPTHPLPLVTFLQGSLFPADPQTLISGWEFLNGSADLTGDPERPGFILLVPYGRDTTHFYPYPDDTGLGWDNWYRNFNRADPAVNLDVAAIDHFIGAVTGRGIVDPNRIYMSGWSNGAAMAILYTLNTPGVASAAVYSNPDPWVDAMDPCAQQPFGNNLKPLMYIHNQCDIIGICHTGGELMTAALKNTMPQLETRSVILDLAQQNEVEACDQSCNYDGSEAGLFTTGTVRHLTWPLLWNDPMFQFMKDHPLN